MDGITGACNYLFLVLLDSVKGSTVVSYAITNTSPQYVYQLYDGSSLTKPEADDICGRCSTGTVAIVQDVTSNDFIRDSLASPAGIVNGSYWLGLTKGTFSWRWDSGESLGWAAWLPNNPGSSDKYAEAELSASPLWRGRKESFKQNPGASLVCRYDGDTVGVVENDWSGWSLCDVDRHLQIRRKACTSPAADGQSGCTCEDHVTETRDCPEATQVLVESAVGNVLYQQYDMAEDWFQASSLCSRCETGTIMMPKTEQEEDFIVNAFQLTTFRKHFIGLVYDQAAGGWGWQDGTSLDWTNWGTGSPSSSPTDTVATLAYYDLILIQGTYWSSRQTTYESDGVICQYDGVEPGVYGEWGPWGGCVSNFTDTVWTGVRSRQKRCRAPGMAPNTCSCEDEITETESCTPVVVDLYFAGNSAYLLFDAGADFIRANQICATWCTDQPTNVVQYQNQSKYADIYDHLILPHGLRRHHVGLSDVGSEGRWVWQDDSKLEDFPAWQISGQYGGYLLNHALITAQTEPYLTSVMSDSNFEVDLSDSVVCEYTGVAGPGGTHSSWSDWGPCEAGAQTRNRTCLVPAPSLIAGNCRCTGEEQQTQNCTDNSTSTTTTTTTPTTPPTTATPSVTTTSTSSSITEEPTTPAPTTVPPGVTTISTAPPTCVCPACPDITPSNDTTLEDKVRQLVETLTVEKETLSSTRRRLTSAIDIRPSAKSVGICIGSVVVGVVFGFVIFMDLDFFVGIIKSIFKT